MIWLFCKILDVFLDFCKQEFLRHAAAGDKDGQIAIFLFVHAHLDVPSLDKPAQPADQIVRLDLLKKDIAHLIIGALVLDLADDLIALHACLL